MNSEAYVQHNVEAFVKVDSKGWKTLARTVRPLIDRVLEDQVKEAGQFVSLMSRLVVMHPNWATQVAQISLHSTPSAAPGFARSLAEPQARASTGRPIW